MHNVYSRLAHRASREAQGFARRLYLSGESVLLEQKECAAADLAHTIFACSEAEARYFRTLGARRVVLVPNGVDSGAFSWTLPQRSGPPTVLFIGALEWTPNVSAVRFLARDVLPAVRTRVPDARLLIVGRRPTAEVLALADPGRVDIAADVPDVRPYWEQWSASRRYDGPWAADQDPRRARGGRPVVEHADRMRRHRRARHRTSARRPARRVRRRRGREPPRSSRRRGACRQRARARPPRVRLGVDRRPRGGRRGDRDGGRSCIRRNDQSGAAPARGSAR
jgi:hypothetical protein